MNPANFIDESRQFPGLAIATLDQTLQRSRTQDQSQVGTWLMAQFQPGAVRRNELTARKGDGWKIVSYTCHDGLDVMSVILYDALNPCSH